MALRRAAAFLVGCCALLADGSFGEERRYFTSPEHWDEPRMFHHAFDAWYESRLVVEPAQSAEGDLRLVSPNGGYAIVVVAADWESENGELQSRAFVPDLLLHIDRELESPLAIRLLDRYPNFYVSVRWVSEKLVFVRVWWGRVLGTDAILDVESGRFVYREMVQSGIGAFLQHQHLREGRDGSDSN